jgi:hypothetical protein
MTKATLKDQVSRNILSYVDDIVVASKGKTTYISDLVETFANMLEAKLKLVGVLYPGYRRSPVTAKKSRYGRFPPAANYWGTMHPIFDMTHHSWLKTRGHLYLKRTRLMSESYRAFPPRP